MQSRDCLGKKVRVMDGKRDKGNYSICSKVGGRGKGNYDGIFRKGF